MLTGRDNRAVTGTVVVADGNLRIGMAISPLKSETRKATLLDRPRPSPALALAIARNVHSPVGPRSDPSVPRIFHSLTVVKLPMEVQHKCHRYNEIWVKYAIADQDLIDLSVIQAKNHDCSGTQLGTQYKYNSKLHINSHRQKLNNCRQKYGCS